MAFWLAAFLALRADPLVPPQAVPAAAVVASSLDTGVPGGRRGGVTPQRLGGDMGPPVGPIIRFSTSTPRVRLSTTSSSGAD